LRQCDLRHVHHTGCTHQAARTSGNQSRNENLPPCLREALYDDRLKLLAAHRIRLGILGTYQSNEEGNSPHIELAPKFICSRGCNRLDAYCGYKVQRAPQGDMSCVQCQSSSFRISDRSILVDEPSVCHDTSNDRVCVPSVPECVSTRLYSREIIELPLVPPRTSAKTF
jgi:hypothetical protein